MIDVLVIGAGVVGSFIARKLSRYQLTVHVVEKENDVGNVTSMANSAIVHSGYDPKPGSLKALLNVKGCAMYPQICEELDIHYENIGSLTVAIYEEQLKTLEELAIRSKENGVPVEILSAEQVKAMEPNITDEVKGALLAPTAGVVNPFTLSVHTMENAVDNGVILHLDEAVVSIEKKDGFYIVNTNKGSYETKVVINAAGVHGDEIHALVEPIDYEINARKGQYYVLDKIGKGFVNHVIFPLPSEKGKGILVSPTTSGNYIVGPSSEWVDDKDDVSTDKQTLDNIKAQASSMIKNIPFGQTIRIFSGNRPTPSTHDFVIGFSKNDDHFINASGIESPGLTAAPAIADYVVDEFVSKVISLKEKDNFIPTVRKRVDLNKMSIEERNAFIKEHPSYGRIACNCEKVTFGHIEDELSRSVPPRTVVALKKRTRAGFGKCQGGFCQPYAILSIAKHFGVSPMEIKLSKDDSEILKYDAKGDNK